MIIIQNSLSLWAAFTPKPLFEWYAESEEILSNLYSGMKCRNSTFNAKGWRVIIVAVKVGAVKLYVLALEVLSQKENRMKLSLLQNLLVF
jgi:hypothetical protein